MPGLLVPQDSRYAEVGVQQVDEHVVQSDVSKDAHTFLLSRLPKVR